MAALHQSLATLGPTDISSVPQDSESLASYLQSTFKSAQTIIDSVPLPPPSEDQGRRRVFNDLEISSSLARSDILDPDNEVLQKEWGKPLKLSAKDNPLGMSVYKMAGKDGNGAWFARRSVHEGLSFRKWHDGLEKEFRETLQAKGAQGAPGEGNIRGIGAERRVLEEKVDGVGKEEVYYLSAQFPGPSAPRDFVTLLLTSSDALDMSASTNGDSSKPSDSPQHFMVVSKPCIHPECPPRSGFVRGQYESVEFIREIPRKPKRSMSAVDLPRVSFDDSNLDKNSSDRIIKTETDGPSTAANEQPASPIVAEGKTGLRQRGKTTSIVRRDLQGRLFNVGDAKNKEPHPVEWIMITRSDPGGSVPRFMVERGTPGSIVADASKFLEWASKAGAADNTKDEGHEDTVEDGASMEKDVQDSPSTRIDNSGPDVRKEAKTETPSALKPDEAEKSASVGMIGSVANMAMTNIESYGPKSLVDRLPGHSGSSAETANDSLDKSQIFTDKDGDSKNDSSQTSSPTASFFSLNSADDQANDTISTESPQSQSKSNDAKSTLTPHEKELAKLQNRKKTLDTKLEQARKKEVKDKAELTAKEEERVRKAEERHARETAKQEERYARQVAKLDAKKRKAEEKDERVRLSREKEEMRQQLESVRKERDMLKEQVGALQRENTALVVRLGKMEDGKDVLREVKAEVLDGDGRSRSGSLRKSRPGTPDRGKSGTILARESTLKESFK